MTRSSPIWLPIGFAIALIGIGFKYWQLPVDQAVLPVALYTPGLAAVAVVAMLLRAFGTGRFLRVWLGLGASLIGTVIGSLLLLRSSRRPQ